MALTQIFRGRARSGKRAWMVLFWLCLIWGILLVFVFTRSYSTLHAWSGWLAPDGELKSFTPDIFVTLRSFLLPFGVGLLIAGLLGVIREPSRAWLERFRQTLIKLGGRLWTDTGSLASSARSIVREESRLIAGVAVLTLLAALLRAYYLSQQMGGDEAYTYMAFASQGFWTAISDYHLPNNHVFHTLLVLLSTQLLGNAPWAIRLPAFLFGVLTVPATALLALALYGRRVSLVTASIIAIMPIMINYSSHARGYSAMAFFFVTLLLLSLYLRRHENIVAWGLFSVAASLGLFTHPAMLYPFGIVMTWLFLSALIKDVAEDYKVRFLYELIGVGAVTFILTLALYAPLLFVSGPGSLFGNKYVEALDWLAFSWNLPLMVNNIWLDWSRGIPAVLIGLFVAGLAAALLFGRGRVQHKVPLGLATLLWIGILIIVQRVVPWPRVWLFLLPLFVTWVAAGWVWLLDWVGARLPAARQATHFGLALLVIVPVALALVKDTCIYLETRGDLGHVEKTALFLKHTLHPGDALIAFPDTKVLRYYLERNGVPWDYAAGIKQKDFRRVLVVVNTTNERTLEWLVDWKDITERVDMGTAEVVFESGPLEVYAVDPNNSKK